MADDRDLPKIDTTKAHPARIYDAWLGGKDNFAADREAAELALQAYPALAEAIQSNRAFLGRAVRFLVGAGVRQFLDIGTGLPAADNTHEVAQREAPDSRIVYVDNDPIVLRHAQALLTSTPEGACDYIQADLSAPETILADAARTLDFDRPVALMLLAVLQFALDEQDPYGLVSRLTAALPPRQLPGDLAPDRRLQPQPGRVDDGVQRAVSRAGGSPGQGADRPVLRRPGPP